MTESLLGRGRKSTRRRWWCDDGRIIAERALLTSSPSTPRILTSEFVIADRRPLSRLGAYGAFERGENPTLLWRLHRNEPGCVVGEHMQVFFWWCWWWWLWRLTEMERFGEVEENRTEGTEPEEPERLTRVGEVDRWWNKAVEREKLEVEDANAEEELDGGPRSCLVDFLEDSAAIFRERKYKREGEVLLF